MVLKLVLNQKLLPQVASLKIFIKRLGEGGYAFSGTEIIVKSYLAA